MKFKNLEIAKEFFSPIFKEEKLPSKLFKFSTNYTQEEVDEYNNIWKKDEEIKETHFIVSYEQDLYWYADNSLVREISYARRGQIYYLLCNIETLEISVLATKPDGSGCEVLMPDILIEWFLKGYLVS